jgi:hypothetical protein
MSWSSFSRLRARTGRCLALWGTTSGHPNAQVRVKAIKNTLAVAPEKARQALEELANSKEYPASGEAGMSVWALDEGIFKPR